MTSIDFAPVTLVAGDFDGDGKPDLVAAGSNSPIYFLHGNGNGTFGAPVFVGYVDYPYALAAADLNGDGVLDLVSVVSGYPNLLAFLGHGDGTFADPIATPLDAYADSLALGLLDDDAYPDVVVAGYPDHSLVVLRGQGDGSFGRSDGPGDRIAADRGPARRFQRRWKPRHRGRGAAEWLDRILRRARRRRPSARRSSRPPGRRPSARSPSISTTTACSTWPSSRATATPRRPADCRSSLETGTARFRRARRTSPEAEAEAAAAADFDGDGLVDVAFASNSIAEAWLFPGRGDGTLRAAPYALFGLPAAIAVAGDFNEDGRSDLASAGYGAGSGFAFVNVALAEPGSRFGPPAIYPIQRDSR